MGHRWTIILLPPVPMAVGGLIGVMSIIGVLVNAKVNIPVSIQGSILGNIQGSGPGMTLVLGMSH